MQNQPRALILAGGMGTRLQPYTFFVPKPMLPLGDKPLLEHLILWLRENGVSEFVISVSYLRRSIESYFASGKEWKVSISYARSTTPLGIAGQIMSARDKINSTFYLLYGDSVFDFDLKNMLDFHRKTNSKLTMGLMHYSQKLAYGLIERDSKGRVTAWNEKPEVGGLINVGCYVAEPTLFKYIPKGKMYGFDSVVRDMIKAGETVSSYIIEGKEFIDIGNEQSYRRAYDSFLDKMGKVL
ncbi:MAG: nucleotidyltransferase family protein [Nitrososphaerota archaeon]|nr:nucleotidyltransferase family protein [Nitrososphaerota archaeon]